MVDKNDLTFKNNDITLMDQTETKQAIFLYNRFKINFLFIPFLFIIATIIIYKNNPLASYITGGILLLLTLNLYKHLSFKYRNLLYIAKHNDLIRHDEKIRRMEREKNNKNTTNTQTINETAKIIKEQKTIPPKLPKRG